MKTIYKNSNLIEPLVDGDFDVLQVIGGAGTGKTTTLKTVINKMKEKEITYHLLATTGVAARITSLKTGEEASTIHQKIFRFSTHLSSDGESVFELINNENESGSLQFVIIDEAGMIGNKKHAESNLIYGSGRLLSDLIDSFKIKRGSKTKLILVGDQFQLAPVFEEFSPALSKSYLEEIFHLRVLEIKLMENFRQTEAPAILDFAKEFLKKD
jgi:ATP-dependent exoDNAse (exonuclease V) alpha subunit